MEPGPVHEALNRIKWLMGTWKSVTGEGTYPTIEPFTFCEEISFTSVGQPVLNYNAVSWHPTTGKPMHLERGFLRIDTESNSVAFMIAHNFGLTSLEEGILEGPDLMQVKTYHIGRMDFAKGPKVTEIARSYKLLDDGKLELYLIVATENTPLDKHLRVQYEKVSS